MFNRTASKTADYIAHGPRSLAPVFSKLNPKQRRRIEKSSKKVADLLGEMPIIDISPASPKADSIPPVSQVVEEKPGKKGGKGKKAPLAPILRYKLIPAPTVPRPPTPDAMSTLQVPDVRPRKSIPNSLNLGPTAWRSAAGPQSPLQYNMYVCF